MKLFTVEQMVAAEKTADSQGNSYAQMMESAGRTAADFLKVGMGASSAAMGDAYSAVAENVDASGLSASSES